jgi:hypothetical protein
MGGHAFSHQQDPFMYNPQAHHPHQANHPQQMSQYGRMATVSNAGATNPSLALGGGVDRLTSNSLAAAAGMGGMNAERALGTTGNSDNAAAEFGGEDSRKTMEFIVQLLNVQTRETALLELSKKREAVPELALVLWHSFGVLPISFKSRGMRLLTWGCYRCHDFSATGDHLRLPTAQPITAHSCRIKSRLQCARSTTVCRIASRD